MAEESGGRVLVVEDDAATAAWVVRGLRAARFEVELVVDGLEASRRLVSEPWSAAVLDLNLPGAHGFEVLAAAKHRTSFPVIVLTARGELPDRLRAFELGAADFLSKPFWIEELVARLRSRLRQRTDGSAPRRTLRWGAVVVDLDARTAVVDGHLAALTPTEFSVLAFLCERKGRAISRRTLAEHALASLDEPDARTVDSHVARLRRKLGDGATAIATVWGIGYRFDPDDPEAQ